MINDLVTWTSRVVHISVESLRYECVVVHFRFMIDVSTLRTSAVVQSTTIGESRWKKRGRPSSGGGGAIACNRRQRQTTGVENILLFLLIYNHLRLPIGPNQSTSLKRWPFFLFIIYIFYSLGLGDTHLQRIL